MAGLPTLTASYSGLVNGDTPASLITQPTLSDHGDGEQPCFRGPYAITASGAADPDYAISYVPGDADGDPRPADHHGRQPEHGLRRGLPALTASYSGLVNGDTPASLTAQPRFRPRRRRASHVSGSPYAITASGAADPDYTISYVPGTLTVTPAVLTITADDQTSRIRRG